MNRDQSIDPALADLDEQYSDAGIPADLHTFQQQESWLDRALRLGYLEDEEATF